MSGGGFIRRVQAREKIMIKFALALSSLAMAMPAALIVMVTADPALGAASTAAPLELKKPAAARPWQRYKVDSQGSSWPSSRAFRFTRTSSLGAQRATS